MKMTGRSPVIFIVVLGVVFVRSIKKERCRVRVQDLRYGSSDDDSEVQASKFVMFKVGVSPCLKEASPKKVVHFQESSTLATVYTPRPFIA